MCFPLELFFRSDQKQLKQDNRISRIQQISMAKWCGYYIDTTVYWIAMKKMFCLDNSLEKNWIVRFTRQREKYANSKSAMRKIKMQEHDPRNVSAISSMEKSKIHFHFPATTQQKIYVPTNDAFSAWCVKF